MIKIRKALVICLEDPSSNPRPLRAIQLCREMGWDTVVMGYPPKKEIPGVRYVTIPLPSNAITHKILRKFCVLLLDYLLRNPFRHFLLPLWLFRYGIKYSRTQHINSEEFDIVIAENIQLLPLVLFAKREAKVLFDAREYYPRQNEGEIRFELFEKRGRVNICRHLLHRCDAVVTVSEGLRREYMKEFGVAAEPYRSTPPYFDLPVRRTNPKRIRMVYHGAANRNRRLENLIEVAALLDDRFSLDLVLVGNPRYRQELMRKAAGMARIGFPEPIPSNRIVPTVAEYDIGFFYYEPTGFNIAHCLPNKFFEYIQARLMIAIGPSPDMAELVNQYGCGVVAEEFSVQSMAKALNSLAAEDIDECKRNSDRAARELCFEKESGKMIAILDRLLV